MTLSKHRTFRTLFTIMQDMPWFRAKSVSAVFEAKAQFGHLSQLVKKTMDVAAPLKSDRCSKGTDWRPPLSLYCETPAT